MIQSNRILVIGGTGTVGREVVAQLAADGASVRAMVRRPGAAALPKGVEAVQGDLSTPETLDEALRDIDSVFLVWVAPPATVDPVLERIAATARRIVYLSAPIKTQHPLFQGSQPNLGSVLATAIENRIQASGLEWTILRPGMFAANALGWWAPQVRSGNVVRWPYTEVPTAPIDERDIAAVGVRALREPGHAGAEYVLTGAESLTQAEQIATIGRAVGRSIRVEEMAPDEARREQIAGMPLPLIDILLASWAAAQGQPAFVTNTFAEVMGRPPRTFFQWASDHSAAFMANSLSA